MRILMTMFGWADGGGGTILPRQIAQELARRGHAVTVVCAAVPPLPGAGPYAVREHDDAGVHVLGVHNRPTPFLDDRAPAREVHDPAAVRVFAAALRAHAPDVVHFHNFLGLSAGITGIAAEAGLPSCYSPHNFWPVCPTLYLQLPGLAICGGPAPDGANCLGCTNATEPGSAYAARRDRLREALARDVGLCLPASRAVRDVFVANGYPADWLRVLPHGNARAERLWRDVGARREPGRHGPLRFGFVGSVLPIKGVHLLVGAAQALRGACEVHVHGDGPREYVDALRKLDRRRIVRFHGAYDAGDLTRHLAGIDVGVVPSTCLDHAPLVLGELQAARVPVLGARIGGIPDYLQTDAGRLFPAGDMAALGVAMQELVDDPAQVAAWQRRLQPPRSFAAHVDALEAVYAELCARRPAAAVAPAASVPAAPPAAATPTPSPRMKLNLGCGSHRLPGWVHVDKFAGASPDRVVDLEQLPWPFPDECASEVLLRHVLEHLGRDNDTFLGIVRELWRVCAPRATVRILVPHPRHQDFLQDPTHVRAILPETFLHFSLAVNKQWQERGMPGTPLARQLGVDFTILSVDQRLDPHWQAWLRADPARQREIDAIARASNNVVQEVEIVLRAEKPFAG